MALIVLAGTAAGILLGIGLLIAGLWGGIAGLALAGILFLLLYQYSVPLILGMHQAVPCEYKKIKGMAEALSREAKVILPRLWLVPSPRLNAFALMGTTRKNASLVLGMGILELPEEEIEAVLCHGIAHIRNRDVRAYTMAAALGVGVSWLAQKGYHAVFFWGDRGKRAVPSLLAMGIFGLPAAFLVWLGTATNWKFKADWRGALIKKNPEAMASALRKITEEARASPSPGFAASSHLWMVNPFREDFFNQLFRRHPPLERRVERLEVLKSI